MISEAETADIVTFSDGIKINRSIPRTMTEAGLHYLGRLARTVPEGGTIVEVGPLYGSSTWVLRHNSHPSVRIWSLDTWEPQDWIPRRLPDALPFGIDAFHHYIRDCEGVEAVQGWSPDSVADSWKRPIDLFFDDATHGDPGFSANVNFFLPFVTPGGILCGDDFAAGWPDIIRVVTELGARWDTRPEVAGRVWALLNEGGARADVSSVAERIGPWSDGDLSLEVRNASGDIHTGQPRMWTGRLRADDPITGLAVRGVSPQSPDGRIAVVLTDGTEIGDLAFGVMHDFPTPVANVAFQAVKASGRRLLYQGCELVEGTRTLNTPAGRNGGLLTKQAPATPLTALRIEVR